MYTEYAVLSARFHKNGGHSTRHTFDLFHIGRIDDKLFEILNRGRPEQIAANSGHHEYRSSAQPGCGRLIGALASESKIKPLAENGFTRLRKTIGEGGQINIGAANHCNSRDLRHSLGDLVDSFESS